MYESDLVANAGRFINHHNMVWMRKLEVPVAQVWEAVSTKQGLDEWWITPVEIDLRLGGAFSHHWENTITGLKNNEYIDFGDVSGNPGGERFELKVDGSGTIFSLLDTAVWPEDLVPGKSQLPAAANGIDKVQPGGPGTPWSGIAGGWHHSVDKLEAHLTGNALNHSWEDLCRFYAGYLADHFRWLELMTAYRERAKLNSK